MQLSGQSLRGSWEATNVIFELENAHRDKQKAIAQKTAAEDALQRAEVAAQEARRAQELAESKAQAAERAQELAEGKTHTAQHAQQQVEGDLCQASGQVAALQQELDQAYDAIFSLEDDVHATWNHAVTWSEAYKSLKETGKQHMFANSAVCVKGIPSTCC